MPKAGHGDSASYRSPEPTKGRSVISPSAEAPEPKAKKAKVRSGPQTMNADARNQKLQEFTVLLTSGDGRDEAALFQAAVGIYKPRLQEAWSAAGRSSTEFEGFMARRNAWRRSGTSKAVGPVKLDAPQIDAAAGSSTAAEKTPPKLLEAKYDINTKSAKATINGKELTTTHFLPKDEAKGQSSECLGVFDLGDGETTTMKVLGIWWGLVDESKQVGSAPPSLRQLGKLKKLPGGDLEEEGG